MKYEERICPRCGKCYADPPALSRADNQTEICPLCGAEEAMSAFKEYQQRKKRKRTITEMLKEMKEIERKNDEHVRLFLEEQNHRGEG